MTTLKTFGRNRFRFQKLFPDAIFEGYECNIKYCFFSFKRKTGIYSKTLIKRICDSENIKILFE